MLGYRLYFLDGGNSIQARQNFTADSDADAPTIVDLLWQACADWYPNYELWNARRLVQPRSRGSRPGNAIVRHIRVQTGTAIMSSSAPKTAAEAARQLRLRALVRRIFRRRRRRLLRRRGVQACPSDDRARDHGLADLCRVGIARGAARLKGAIWNPTGGEIGQIDALAREISAAIADPASAEAEAMRRAI